MSEGPSQTDPYKFLARFTSELHAQLKDDARKQGRSIHALVSSLLEESLDRYPVVEVMPVILQVTDKPFGMRLKTELHQSLNRAFEQAGQERSFNLEIVGRLILMTSPSRQTILDAWSQLNQLILSTISSCPNHSDLHGLREAREKFEWQLRHALTCQATITSSCG